VLFSSLAIFFASLWVWSHWHHSFVVASRVEVHCVDSRIVFHLHSLAAGYDLRISPIGNSWQYLSAIKQIDNRWGLGSTNGWGTDILVTPHWCYILVASIVAAAPWISMHYSLRTLLIVTTLAAAVLGLGIWLTS
jgi:hypothetical protein